MQDACTLSYLGQDTELYGRQRMFGSLGWGLAIFIVATILGNKEITITPSLHECVSLDQSKSLTFHACGTSGPLEKNYTICFAAFSVCMTFALICATRFEFSYDKTEQVPLKTLNEDLKKRVASTANQQEQYQTITASNTIKLMQIIQIFTSMKNGTFLFIAW